MSGTGAKPSSNLAGSKRRSLSGEGGLLNKMFGSSGNNGRADGASPATATSTQSDGTAPTQSPTESSISAIEEGKDEGSSAAPSPARKSMEEVSASTDKKRRSSGVGRARDLFSSAKQHFTTPDGKPTERSLPQTPFQKLGKTDPALSVPQGSLNNSAGESVPGPRSTFRVGVTEDKNKKCRRTMEDTHAYLYNFLSTPAPATGSSDLSLKKGASSTSESTTSISDASSTQGVVETDNGYFAVFDGHAGSFAADWCGKKVHILLEDVIRKHPNTPIPELLDMTFTSVDNQLEKLPLKNSGCTAVIAVLRWEDRIPNSQSATGSTAIAPALESESKNKDAPDTESKLRQAATRQRVLYTANVGDARIVLCRNGKALRLSYDHKGSDENEGKRIAGAGGLILNNRVNGVLAVTRALGDAYMKDLVTGHPYTTETVIQPDLDEFLILACDGLWDVCTDQEAVDLIRGTPSPQEASRMLVEFALGRFSTDNLSCMVVRFDGKAVERTVASQEPPIGVEGDQASAAGNVTEAEAIVAESKRKLEGTGQPAGTIPESLVQVVEPKKEVAKDLEAPELNIEAVQKARKDGGGI